MRKLVAAALSALFAVSLAASVMVSVVVSVMASGAAAQEREGYYYPEIGSEEVFRRDMIEGPPTDREVRVRFITQITKAQLAAPENPPFVIFEKGSESQHMIIVALNDDVFRSLHRARAVLAQLTANARGTEFFRETGLDTRATWFDLAKMLGFEDVVISNGVTWAHRVILE